MKSAVVFRCVVIAVGSIISFGWHPSERKESLMGFRDPAGERSAESRFDATLSADDLREWMKHLTARPHHLGSAYDHDNALYMASLFRSWGWDASVEEFSALFPTPKTRVVELLQPVPFRAALVEPPLPEDSTSGETSEQLPVYNAFSIDGDVTAPLVYVNYGLTKDYEDLEQRGIDVRGKIVIARYGRSWRGIKPKLAAEHGAVGCIIYSDPHEDGYFRGDVYPGGAYRNESGAQRGSVADMPIYTGDVSTPFVGAVKGVKHLPPKDIRILTNIPVLPISWGDARPLLNALGGEVVPEDWRGSLPLTYHFGPGPAVVHLKLEFSWDIVPVYDVCATLRGSALPDEWIVRGNHHDAWVNGAGDPVSGLVAMLAEAKGLGRLHAGGWNPKRTIRYCAWDGEEPGLVGSTEWAETHAEELAKHAVLYVNSDGNGRGFFGVGGSEICENFVTEVAKDVTDPETGVSVFERLRARQLVDGTAEERKEIFGRSTVAVDPLGSGSDFTPFLQHLGIACLNIGYGGEGGGGSYHSVYDSYSHYTRFGDPGFQYGLVLAKTGGRIVMRLADADLLPFDFSHASETFGGYVKELIKLADDLRNRTDEENRLIREKAWSLAADPKHPVSGPKWKEPVPFIDFAPLQNAAAALQRSAAAFDRARTDMKVPDNVDGLDAMLFMSERALMLKEGLPGRPWFTHAIYAPGLYAGYDVKTIPGVREAIEQRNWKQADEQIVKAAGAIRRYADAIDEITTRITPKGEK